MSIFSNIVILLVTTVGNNIGMNIVLVDITPPKFSNLVWMYEQYTNIPTLFNSIALHKLKQKWFKSKYRLWIYWREKHKHLKKYIDLQSQAIYVDHFFFCKKSQHILKYGASSMHVGTLNT